MINFDFTFVSFNNVFVFLCIKYHIIYNILKLSNKSNTLEILEAQSSVQLLLKNAILQKCKILCQDHNKHFHNYFRDNNLNLKVQFLYKVGKVDYQLPN